MECLECSSRLWEYLDGELGAEEVLAMRCHLARCVGCRPAYECDRAFLALLARCGQLAPATPSLRQALRERLAQLE
jgi:mycothiol system anti-sigma-R factor